jgi:beta-fructofuranosidase
MANHFDIRFAVTRREFIALTSAALASTALNAQTTSGLANDRHRPRFHLMPPSAWMNDPNGPLFWRGQYHMFYQYSPVISIAGPKYWGHAISSDLVHWKNLGIALSPTPGGPDKNGCWSGSAVINNGTPTLVYTGVTWSAETEFAERKKGLVPERQMVAVAADPRDENLITWTKISQNPVLAAPPAGMKVVGWRDPCLWKEGNSWYMVIGAGEVGRGGMALLYTSKDLRNWTYLHPLAVAKPNPESQDASRPWASMWECPDFFLLNGKPILLVARGNTYLTGTYANHKFDQHSDGQIDFGSAAYAQKTMQDEKDRRIWWAWIREKRTTEAQAAAGWAGVMSLPKLLKLRPDGKLGVEPAEELKVLRRAKRTIADQKIAPNGPLLLRGFDSDCAEIEAEIDLGDAHQAGLRVRSTRDGSEQTLIGYDRDTKKLFCDTSASSSDPETKVAPPLRGRGMEGGSIKLQHGETLRLRIYLDASVIETFANGRASLTDRVYPSSAESLGIGLFAKGGTARSRSVTLWDLAPISTDRFTSGAELFRV